MIDYSVFIGTSQVVPCEENTAYIFRQGVPLCRTIFLLQCLQVAR